MYTQHVEEHGQAVVEECRTRLAPVHQEMERLLEGVEVQTSEHQAVLLQHRDELSSLASQALNTANNFLSNELQQDLPTGEWNSQHLITICII